MSVLKITLLYIEMQLISYLCIMVTFLGQDIMVQYCFIQVCEHVVNATSSGEPLSPSLTARMIKYMILKRRTKEIAEKRALAEVGAEVGRGEGVSRGRGKRYEERISLP